MRVIAGSAGGLRLMAPTGTTTRPTADRIKEALFSILESTDAVADAQVLDLFSGSGALAIEALSRGAVHAVLVEKSRPALEVLRRNLQHTGMSERATVYAQDVFQTIEQLTRHGNRFDLVFLDPPYLKGLHVKVMERLNTVLNRSGIVIAEAASRHPLPETIAQFRRADRRIYGDTALEFFIPEASDAP